MSIVKITNVSPATVYLRDIYTDIASEKSKTIVRTPAELSDMVALQQFISAGVLSVDITLQPGEEESELVSIWPLGMNWRGVVANFAALPMTKNRTGDIRLTLSTFQLWRWDGASWSLVGTGPSGAAGGDLGGTYPNPTVTGIQGYMIEGAAPSNGDALLYNSFTNEWEHAPIVFGGGPPTGPAGGDLSGLYPDPAVTGLQTRPVAVAAPSSGDALVWDGVAWTPTSVTGIIDSYLPPFGSFSDNTDQTIPTLPASVAVQYNTVEVSAGVTVTNNGLGKPTRLTVSEDGLYAFQISPQLYHTGGTGTAIYFWAKIDGVDVPRSASSLEMGNNNSRTLPFLQLDVPMNAGQYFEWMFSQTGLNSTLEHFPASGPVPEIPSVIASIRRIGSKP